MINLENLLNKNIAIYGLGTETERFIAQHGDGLSIVGLLDGFWDSGEMYGHRIISLDEAVKVGVHTIIVVARPGSCKAIAKQIGERCAKEGIKLLDVRGKNLLKKTEVAYDFEGIQAGSEKELMDEIDKADAVSFDLFDTLVVRKVFEYTDVFDLVDYKLRQNGIVIDDFAKRRLGLEKELSKSCAPKLVDIYGRLLEDCGDVSLSAEDMAELERKIDQGLIVKRAGMDEVFSHAKVCGKVYITTDCYYSKRQIEELLNDLGINGYQDIIISCEYGKAKNQGLFDVLKDQVRDAFGGKENTKILHVGDDEYTDIESAEKSGIDTFRVLNGRDLFYTLGGLGIEAEMQSIADKVKLGMVFSRLFGDPFCFEKNEKKLSVSSAYELGYDFIGPLMVDFTHWFKEMVHKADIDEILFCARDGYLLQKLYSQIDNSIDSKYFLTSRTAAIRAGMESAADVEYVDSMRFFGDDRKALQVRFGIDKEFDSAGGRTALIIEKSNQQKENYKKYIEKIGAKGKQIAVFDFVAKGTSQLFLQKLFDGHLKGFYFLQLEPEFMQRNNLDIQPFYSDEERDASAIFDDYYVLETIVTSPDPSVDEFDLEGNPVFAIETRSSESIRCAMDIQAGIEAFFKDYIGIAPEEHRTINKRMDEKLLSLIKKVHVNDEEFYKLVVEDPFFGRMTDIREVL
ncbi:MAG: hypothetical protein K6G87_13505 [Butyrivibrio sp.]|uniref:hypothetical protein n=1 Tax=Butyrivibrio sp. TaxID=28121 RepID=UPI0025E9B5A3|nr:hypothetical protein [Butyrivibrio sp.]MCR5772232.1 hypothetical protein [Butyrivibrio sp.]